MEIKVSHLFSNEEDCIHQTKTDYEKEGELIRSPVSLYMKC